MCPTQIRGYSLLSACLRYILGERDREESKAFSVITLWLVIAEPPHGHGQFQLEKGSTFESGRTGKSRFSHKYPNSYLYGFDPCNRVSLVRLICWSVIQRIWASPTFPLAFSDCGKLENLFKLWKENCKGLNWFNKKKHQIKERMSISIIIYLPLSVLVIHVWSSPILPSNQ